MKILHVIPDEKFTKPFIHFIYENFNPLEHIFVIYDTNVSTLQIICNDVIYSTPIIKLIFFAKLLITSDKIIIHGLFRPELVILLALQPWLFKKCYWVIWGGDLYYYLIRSNSTKSNAHEYLRKIVIKRFGGFITHIKGDYELAREWYGAKGKYYYSFMYPSNLYKEYSLSDGIKQDDRVYIQIGNSADPTNNHIEVLDKLQRYKDMDIEIICPLSYGDKAYAKKVINYGTEIFGDKFVPITEFMPFDKYLNILAKIDIAIFNHKRQQAMGNITTLLGLGKKVYIREEITTWQFCINHDLKVHSANGNYNDLFEEMDEEIKQKNIKNVKTKFSEEKLLEDWKKIFNEGELK